MTPIVIPLINREGGVVVETTVSYFLKHFFKTSLAYYSVTYQAENDLENLISLLKHIGYQYGGLEAWKAGVMFIAENHYHLPIETIKEIIRKTCTYAQ